MSAHAPNEARGVADAIEDYVAADVPIDAVADSPNGDTCARRVRFLSDGTFAYKDHRDVTHTLTVTAGTIEDAQITEVIAPTDVDCRLEW